MEHEDMDPLLRAYVDRGSCHCPSCFYALKGLRSDQCPECGESISLTLQGDSDRRSGWLVGMIAVSSMFGLFGVFVPLTVIIGEGPPGRMWSLYLGALLSWPLMIFWLLCRRRFPRWRDSVRQVLATGVLLLTLLLMLAAIAQI